MGNKQVKRQRLNRNQSLRDMSDQPRDLIQAPQKSHSPPPIESTSERFQRNSQITLQELDTKIVETREKIKECDQEIQNLESSPTSASQKLLFISKMKRENLNKFVDDLILKQYFLDKKVFESSLLAPEVVTQQEDVKRGEVKEKVPSFRDILRQQRKSEMVCNDVQEVSTSLSRNPFFTVQPERFDADGDGRRDRGGVAASGLLRKSEVSGVGVKGREVGKKNNKKIANPFCKNNKNVKNRSRMSSLPNFSRPSPKREIPWYLKGTEYDQ